MFDTRTAENSNDADPSDIPGCFRFEGAWWICAQYSAISQDDKIALPPRGLAILGGAPWRTTQAVTEAGGDSQTVSLVGAPRPYISGLVDILQIHQREIREGDYIWLNKRWDDDEPPVLRVRRVRRRPELGVAEEIARQSGAYFLRSSTTDQFCGVLAGILTLPQSSTWEDVVWRLNQRGDAQLALLVRRYIDSAYNAGLIVNLEPAVDASRKTTPAPDVSDFLQLINGS
ncbi:hypothetical protein E1293_04740 [Actinomadura darangshiensis]|uniref:Uncharacterized protein n=1 Tax=Actinomadura darangshiensis TaxID=705336 RepID=A0A4R5BVY6_9ACTN|nr:hypothetical protein [Actinomadura darangshiensis]TDD89520.1 hypothetical protein E1293_04740 [Actinomadura darangshiensis]